MSDEKLVNTIRDVTFLTRFAEGVGLISFSAVLGIGMIWYYTNLKSFEIAKNIYSETLYDMEAKKTD